MSAAHALKKLIRLVSPMKGWMTAAIFLGILGNTAAAMIPVLGAAGLALLFAGGTLPAALIAAIVLCAVLRGVLRYGEQACNHYIAFRLLAHIRDLVFGKLRQLGAGRLEKKRKGDLVALLSADVELLEVFYAHTISPVCIAIGCAVLFCAFGWAIHPLIGMLLLASYLCTGLLVPMLVMKKSGPAGEKIRKEAGELNTLVLENLNGLAENLRFGVIERRQAQIDEKTVELAGQERKLKSMEALIQSSMQWISAFFCLLMLGLCAFLVKRGQLAAVMVLPALVLQASTFGPFAALANLGAGLAQTLGSAVRVMSLLEEEPETPDVIDGVLAKDGDVQVQNISFAYEKDAPVLKNFLLRVPQGQLLGISGPSGCGKSTLLRLLMRFWDPQQGSIALGGEDLRTIDTKSLRHRQAMMMQETMLFHASVKDNLRIAKEDATEEEMRAACRMAEIDGLIQSLENGYDSIIGEGGSTLSAGERQRLGLARVFLADPAMMLLDEPTSNLDALNEGAILRAIDQFRKDRTIFLVSHKKGTLSFADAMLRMEPEGGRAETEGRKG